MFTAVSARREGGRYRRALPSSSSGEADPLGRDHSCLRQSRQHSPCLSPVSTQILMLASVRRAMVSGTPCWSLSSMAVAPSS